MEKPTVKGKKNYENQIERKFSYSRYPPHGIPKHVLNRTLEIVNDPKDEFWLNKNISCAPLMGIEINETKHSDSYKKLHLARKCLLTRDWQNLAKLLTSNLINDSIVKKTSYPIFSEYASILLALEDPGLLEKLQGTMATSITHSNNKVEKGATEDTNNTVTI